LHDAADHREEITSRLTLLGVVARMTRHGGQSTVKVSLQHENRAALVWSVTQVRNTLSGHRGAKDRRATPGAALDSYLPPLARWQMAWPPPRRRRTSPFRMNYRSYPRFDPNESAIFTRGISRYFRF
jgi:hypothetical protein